ncbi:MAG: hypothetical protein R6V13_12945, partial [Anaerolineae bacterium]
MKPDLASVGVGCAGSLPHPFGIMPHYVSTPMLEASSVIEASLPTVIGYFLNVMEYSRQEDQRL